MKMKRVSIGLLALLLFSISNIYSSSAHSSMIEQFPKGNETISDMPLEVKLSFDEELLDLGSGNSVIVRNPEGTEITTGPTVLLSSKISRKLTASTLPGKYSVSYRVVSADGHVVEGTYQFTLRTKSESKSPTPIAVPSKSETALPQVITTDHVNHAEGFFLHHRDHIILGSLALLVIGIWAYASRRKWRDLSD
jgi:methionine-rich copper-binding protein CopC